MKNTLRILFAFILNFFESGNNDYQYKESHRVVLIVIGVLFNGLAMAVITMAQDQDIAYYFPALIFGGMGFLGFIIGFLGNDRAVATIWGNTN